jgi:hypothetical protein
MKASERRRWERLPLAIPVFVRGLDPTGRQFVDFATALDISVGGALLALHRFLPKGSRILLEIPSAAVAVDKNASPRSVRQRLYAKTVRITDGDRCKLVGVNFSVPLKIDQHRSAECAILKRHPAKAKAARKS